jgi:hypothetical protein
MTYPDEINVAKSQKVLRNLIEGIHVGRNLFLECKSKFGLTKHINQNKLFDCCFRWIQGPDEILPHLVAISDEIKPENFAISRQIYTVRKSG